MYVQLLLSAAPPPFWNSQFFKLKVTSKINHLFFKDLTDQFYSFTIVIYILSRKKAFMIRNIISSSKYSRWQEEKCRTSCPSYTYMQGRINHVGVPSQCNSRGPCSSIWRSSTLFKLIKARPRGLLSSYLLCRMVNSAVHTCKTLHKNYFCWYNDSTVSSK